MSDRPRPLALSQLVEFPLAELFEGPQRLDLLMFLLGFRPQVGPAGDVVEKRLT